MIAILFLLLGLGDFDHAERAYREGRYQEAGALYQAALLESGVPEGPVLYNMGNCAHRLGRHAEAALYYRRALLRLPCDGEVIFNLHLTEQKLGIDDEARETFLASTAEIVDSFTPGQLLVLVGALQLTGLAGLVLFRRHRMARNGMALIVLIALAGAVYLVQTQWLTGAPEGVVLAKEIALRPEPHTDLEPLLELKAGETVRVEERSDRWIRVEHKKGGGWTERPGVGVVD